MSARKMVLYFSGPGEVNSTETLKAAKDWAEELNVRDVVVATTREPALI
jgi:hypothetical protein